MAENKVLEILSRLFDVKPSTIEETKTLIDVSHNEICNSIQYWISQCTLLFSEVVDIQQNQSLGDDGIDVIVNFLSSKIKIGFQAKSHGDIEKKDFSKDTLAQIQRSKTHDPKHLFVLFSGNLDNPSQLQKIRIIQSELDKIKDGYTICIAPEKVVTIIKAFRDGIHPIKLSTITKDPTALMEAISEALTDDLYKTRVSIEYKSKKEPKKEEYPYEMKLNLKIPKKDGKYNSPWEAIRNSHVIGESVKIDDDIIEKLTVLKEGKIIFDGKPNGVTISPEKPTLPSIKIEVYNEGGKKMDASDEIILVRDKIEGNLIYLSNVDKSCPIQLMLINDAVKNTVNFRITYRPFGSDIATAYKSEKFFTNLQKASKIMIIKSDTNQQILSTQKIPKTEEVSTGWLKFLEEILIIENLTGEKIVLPNSMTDKDFNDALDVADLIKNRERTIKSIKFDAVLKKDIIRQIIEEYKLSNKITSMKMSQHLKADVFGKEIDLGLGHFENLELEIIDELGAIESQLVSSENSEIKIKFKTVDGSTPSFKLDKDL